MTAPSVVDLERLATDAESRDLDVLTVLAEVIAITDHGTDWITAGDVHLSRGVTGWHATIAVPTTRVSSAWLGGRR